MQQVTVKKWGNSHGIRLSSAVLSELGVEDGAVLDAELRNGVLTLKRPASRTRRKFNVDELVQQITSANSHDQIDWGGDAGKEDVD